jgi:hypothetical protein
MFGVRYRQAGELFGLSKAADRPAIGAILIVVCGKTYTWPAWFMVSLPSGKTQ